MLTEDEIATVCGQPAILLRTIKFPISHIKTPYPAAQAPTVTDTGVHMLRDEPTVGSKS